MRGMFTMVFGAPTCGLLAVMASGMQQVLQVVDAFPCANMAAMKLLHGHAQGISVLCLVIIFVLLGNHTQT